MGPRQEERIRKGLEAWKKLPESISGTDVKAEEWDNTQGFLRRLYGLNNDMEYLSQGLKGDKKKKAETLIATFKKRVKAADKPLKAKDYEKFMVDHKDITGYIEEFMDSLQDANEDLSMASAEEDVQLV